MPSGLVISVILHAGFFSLLTIRLIETHHIIERFPTDRFLVRVVDFHSTEPQTRQAAGGGLVYKGAAASSASGPKTPALNSTSGEGASGSPAVSRLTPQRMPANQTLVQPDMSKPILLPQKMPVPLVVLWTPEKPVVKRVVPALPEKASIAVERPSFDTPIKEETVSDLRLSSSAFVTQGPTVPPSTTAPVVVHGPEDTKKVPQTTSKSTEQPTPGRVVSLSDVRMPEGKVVVPMANQTSKATPGAMVPGVLKDPSAVGNGTSNAHNSDTGAGKGAGNHSGLKNDTATAAGNGGPNAGSGVQAGKDGKSGTAQASQDPRSGAATSGPSGAQTAALNNGPSTAQTGAVSGASQGGNSGSGSGNDPSTVHISLPKDGQFGVVVFGSAVADKYPETAELWSGRLASTVYLRVGQSKSWILQYALPRITEASSGGGHLDAPWPFEIVRPNIDPADLDADALILHGLVNKDGRFEKLEVVFPTQVLQAPMILNVLNQWQFRPAKMNGQVSPVEVLLIIPDQSN
jgi:hypothetical protein